MKDRGKSKCPGQVLDKPWTGGAVAKVRFADVAYEAIPYVGALLLTLAVLTYVPAVSMWLPLALK